MEEVEVIFGEVIFEVDLIIMLVELWENRRTWRQSRSRERERRVRSPSSSRSGSRTSMNRDRIRYFKCREYDHFANECPNLVPKDSDRESDGMRSISLHLADNDMGSDM